VPPLRPGNEEEPFEDDLDLQPELDAGVLDRLSAYASEEPGDADEALAALPGVTDAVFENRDLAVEDGHDAEPADMTRSEPDEPGEDASLPGSDEPEPAVAEASHEPEPEPERETSEASVPEPVQAAVPEDDAGPEPTGRRSFRRRRAATAGATDERASEKHRAAKPKRGKDRKAKRLVGLKIGASQIAAAEVVNNGAPELVEVFREPLEPGLVVQGEIRDPEGLALALKRLFELHKLPKRGIRLGLANNRIGVRVFEIEGVTDEQQLDNAIRFRAEEVLPIPLDQAVLDYVVLDDSVREDGTAWKRILLVVAYREVVDRYLQACRSAGLEVVGIDLEAFALLRAIEAPADRSPDAGALVAVAIGHDRTTIAVSTGRHCEFTRVLDWGGWSLNVAIARELDRAPSEVEGLKRQLSFSGSAEVEGFTPEQVAKAREAIQRSLSSFVRELVASLQFYQAQPGALGIGEVVVTGGTAHMDGLPEVLGEQIGVPIRLGDPFKRLKVGPKVVHEGARGSLAVAIGLGIED
jgi:type IV pilus assembly protein PilM